MFKPVHDLMRGDPRVRFSFIAGEDPAQAPVIYRDAGPDARIVGACAAALIPFDAYITSDFTWTRLLHATCRIQMYHGVGGKYGFDAPTAHLDAWHRIFFVNERRLRNCIAAGALEADSPAIRLIGMPKVDRLVNGSIDGRAVIRSLGLDDRRPTVLYAPTWSPASSLNRFGMAIIERLALMPVNLIVKLHDRSRDLRPQYSGGIDWLERLRPLLAGRSAAIAPGADIIPYLVAADVMVTDHSSAGFEYLVLDRPLVRIHLPALLETANVHPDYVALLADVSESTRAVDDTIGAVEHALANPQMRSAARRAVAADLFYRAGTATGRAASALYEAINLDADVLQNLEPGTRSREPETGNGEPVSCRPSA